MYCALGLDHLPHAEEYETLAGFLMVMLRPSAPAHRQRDLGWFQVEVLDVDSYRIDQVMVTRLPEVVGNAALATC